jgi:hypothetical protein
MIAATSGDAIALISFQSDAAQEFLISPVGPQDIESGIYFQIDQQCQTVFMRFFEPAERLDMGAEASIDSRDWKRYTRIVFPENRVFPGYLQCLAFPARHGEYMPEASGVR